MATIYFTSNADSGAGSFRAALSSSVSGDTIEPDPDVDWGSETIAILLSSSIDLGSRVNRTISGGANHRIRFDGQGSVCLFTCVNSNIVFEKCDFVRGYRSAYGCVLYAVNGSPTTLFKRCLIAGNKSDGDAAYALSSNSANYKHTATFENCLIMDEAQLITAIARANSCVFKNCTNICSTNVNAVSAAVSYENSVFGRNIDASNFVNIPDEPPTAETWDKDAWENWDARLVPGSEYLTGAADSLETDFLGLTRKPNGARGAFEGSWLVANETTSPVVLNAAATCDRLELRPGGTLQTNAPDAAIYVNDGCDITGGEIIGAAPGSFVSVPDAWSAEDLDDSENAYIVQRGAQVASVEVGADAVRWTGNNLGRTVAIQKKDRENNAWGEPVLADSGEYETTIVNGDEFRVYDGENFITGVYVFAVPHKPFYQAAATSVNAIDPPYPIWTRAVWEVVKVQNYVIRPYQNAAFLARVKDAFSNDYLLNDGENIAAVSYSVRKKKRYGYQESWLFVEGQVGVEASTDSVMSSLTNDAAWTEDSIGYTFRLVPTESAAAPLFKEIGEYQVIAKIEPENENPITIYFDVEVKDQ